MAPLSIRSQFVPLVLAFVRARGADPRVLVERFALPEIVPGEPPVLPLTTLRDVADAASELVLEPWLGLAMGQSLRRGTYGVMEFAARSASTVGDALGRVMRFQRLINDRVRIGVEDDEAAGEARFDHAIPDDPLGGGRHSNEFAVATVLQLLRDVSGARVLARRAWFSNPAPSEFGPLTTLLGTSDFAFDASSSGFAFDRAALALPIPSADPELLAVLDAQAERFLPKHEGTPFETDLRRAILEAFHDGAPELDRIGKRLGMSGRTLQRRLADEGRTFQDVVDAARKELALRHLADPRMSIDEVAFALGYSQTRAFTRAFQRWQGTSPHAWRKAL